MSKHHLFPFMLNVCVFRYLDLFVGYYYKALFICKGEYNLYEYIFKDRRI